MAGFHDPPGPVRWPIYTTDSRKVGYMEGVWYTDLRGRKIARITKYHVELPAATSSLSAVHVVTPDSTYEG
jgi:hypothetical protein